MFITVFLWRRDKNKYYGLIFVFLCSLYFSLGIETTFILFCLILRFSVWYFSPDLLVGTHLILVGTKTFGPGSCVSRSERTLTPTIWCQGNESYVRYSHALSVDLMQTRDGPWYRSILRSNLLLLVQTVQPSHWTTLVSYLPLIDTSTPRTTRFLSGFTVCVLGTFLSRGTSKKSPWFYRVPLAWRSILDSKSDGVKGRPSGILGRERVCVKEDFYRSGPFYSQVILYSLFFIHY